MKTLFKILFLFPLLIHGLMGQAQCSNEFSYYTFNAGQVSFTNYSVTQDDSTQYGSASYSWNFGDNTTSTTNSYQFDHTYTTSGDFKVCLTVSNTNAGCSVTSCDTVPVNMCQDAANLNYTQTGFDDYSFDAYLANIPGASFSWNFGDGSAISTASAPTHYYSSSGTYPLTLIVTSNQLGCADTSVNNVVVNLCSYPVSFHIDSPASHNTTIVFSVDNPNPAYTYAWSFGDGSTGSDTDVTHTYTSTNNYNVCVTQSDALSGCSVSYCSYELVDLCGMSPNIYVDPSALSVSFAVNTNQNGAPYTYSWAFTDGTPATSTSATPTVTYPQYANYTACVAISTYGGGCTDTICQLFTLAPAMRSIQGQVFKNGAGSCAMVYLITEDTIGHLKAVDSMMMQDSTGLGNCNGYYYFSAPAGIYYVKAALMPIDPDYANFLPTYYGDVLHWADATAIDITNEPQYADNINLITGSNPGAPGFIGGFVSEGAGLDVHGGNNTLRSVGDPLANVQINLLTDAGAAVAYTYTNAQGDYHFSNLPYGTYKLYAEQLNKVPIDAIVTLTATNPSEDAVNISINSNSAVSGIENLDNIVINSIHPNPVVSQLELQLNVKQPADATLKLVDIMGRIEMERQVKLTGSTNQFQIDMEEYAPGVYQLVIESGNKLMDYKVVKVN